MAWCPATGSLDRATLHAAYAAGDTDPVAVVRAVLARMAARGDDPAWISRFDEATLVAAAERLAAGSRTMPPGDLPLWGLPFAVKDNIDVAGLPTTAACPAFSYRPERSALAVERLVAAGAIPLGKTNLDQFATGLNGTRSPYGIPVNPIAPGHVPGGSSSGSAVVVAAGLASFALGTDTAGSGRVPAGFNNLVGVKPTYGLIPTAGLVPACRSLDCISVFAGTVADGYAVLAAAAGTGIAAAAATNLRYGVPSNLEFFGDGKAQAAFEAACRILDGMGWQRVAVDLAPFAAAAELLYDGPWVAERLAAIEPFYRANREALHPVTAAIIGGAERFTAADAFRGLYRLEELKAATLPAWDAMDLLVVPTTPTIYSLAEMAAEPIRNNSRLGTYTNFVNLLGLAALAVPGPWRGDGLPTGITLVAPGGADGLLAGAGAAVEAAVDPTIGATPHRAVARPRMELAVVGAHLSGLPLNHQLTERGARLVRVARTAPAYRLYELAGAVPPKPGLLKVAQDGGAVEVEIWELAMDRYGSFVAGIPAPLGIGTLDLADGSSVQGFLVESAAVRGARDITEHGGWRAWLADRRKLGPKLEASA